MSNTIDYGIDLGTTNSSIAKCDGDEVRIFKNRDQMDVTKSAVRIEKTGRIIVGYRAYQTLASDPGNVSAEFKRLMGQSDHKHFKAASKNLSPEELSSEILKSLLEDARRQTTDPVNAAVITVPAAFGQLQCEATDRAATLAGLIEAPLLQEPVAASIAYGMKPDAKDKRWLIYDLGGGTFDIAVVSTHNRQLTVLNHRGDNMLGGKDFDRLILEKILWPRLKEMFNMPGPDSNVLSRQKLNQVLRGKAEEAKLDLSAYDQTIVSIFDVGNDENGTLIETEIEITIEELNHLVEPIIAKTIDLIRQTMNQSHLDITEISKIILVGGPTQMPIVREMLTNEFDIPLDFSIDPMTVVSYGAAIYASTLFTTEGTKKTIKQGAIYIDLSHETIWSETTCLVAGRIDFSSTNIDSIEILIEGETGHWNSGWIPLEKGYFETNVYLLEGKMNRFWIYLRDEKGNDLTPTPDSFSIRHGLTLAEPPLPYSIGAEILRDDGKTEVDIIFSRSTPLPTQKIITYKANKRLRPSKEPDYIAIKIWEGEYPEPESNMLIGALKINSNAINRAIPEGADIELSITIDMSRLMKVQAYIPCLAQHFETNEVYVPKDNEEDMVQKAQVIDIEIDEYQNRLYELDEIAQQTDNDNIKIKLEKLRKNMDELTDEHYQYKNHEHNDPDNSKRIVQQSKAFRGKLSIIERDIDSQDRLIYLLHKLDVDRNKTEDTVKDWGSKLEKKEFELLCREADRQADREDEKSLEKLSLNFKELEGRILHNQGWYWKQWFEFLCKPRVAFVNNREAKKLIAEGQEAIKRGEEDLLKKIVMKLWDLRPKNTSEVERERALQTGIKRA